MSLVQNILYCIYRQVTEAQYFKDNDETNHIICTGNRTIR